MNTCANIMLHTHKWLASKRSNEKNQHSIVFNSADSNDT